MALAYSITLYHAPSAIFRFTSGFSGQNGKMNIYGVIVSVCLFLFTGQVTALGYIDVTFQCDLGWSLYQGSCFKAVDVAVPYDQAEFTCLTQGGFLYYAENEIEYFDFVSSLLPRKIWLGLHKNDKGNWEMGGNEMPLWVIPRWADFEPNEMRGNHTAVSQDGVMVVDAEMTKLPFVCKRRACLMDYMSCDLSTQCIHKNRKCDGKLDCLDGSDESNCTSSCSQYIKITGTSGSIITGTFDDNKDCTWVLEAPIGRRIRLYLPRVTLEQNTAFIEIRTGIPVMDSTIQVLQYTIPMRSRLIDTFTGTQGPYSIYSDNNFMIIRAYSTDVTTQQASVTFGYVTEIPEMPVVGTVENLTETNSWKSQLIPFSAEKYIPKDLELVWQITAPEGQLITYYLDLTAYTNKGVDDIKYKIMVGNMMQEIQYRNYYTTSNNNLRVSSMMVPINGDVTMKYIIGCGMDIPVSASYGMIISPSPIPNNIQCTWNLTSGLSVSRGMALKFFQLDLQNDPRTIDLASEIKSMDKFEIYKDNSINASLQPVVLYNNSVDNIIHAPGGRFRIVFKSDLALQSKGFKIGFGTDCKALDLSPETNKSTNMTFFKEKVTLSCKTGYDFDMERFNDEDEVTLTCDNGWMIDGQNLGAIPNCKVVYCGTPNKINNGQIVRATGVTYNSTATYKCNPGFQISDSDTATCNEDGKWRTVPTCTSSQCSELKDNLLANGMINIIRGNNFTNGSADFDTIVRFSCSSGYELLGPNLTHCTAAGWTHVIQNNTPSCQKLPCPIPTIRNSISGSTEKVLYDTTYAVSCNPGFRFTSSNQSTVTLTCQANQTFDQMLECRDVDECNETTDSCARTSTMCINTVGSYRCECKKGFTRSDNLTCTDIAECSSGKGGCSDTCVETDGSYYCTCPDGFSLFQGNGTNGFYLPVSENGMKRGDVYHINHTCVPLPCPALSPVSNGRYLTFSDPLSGFHFADSVDLQCMDGYEIQGASAGTTRRTLNCQSNGTWDQLYNCTARACAVPPAPTYGMFDKDILVFNEVLTLTCNLTETTNFSMRTRCIYKNGGVLLGGENVTKCPEIDCGDPDLVMPAGGKYDVKPTTTTYFPSTSKFTFACQPGFDITGFSYDSVSNSTVKCKANGRWSFGTLACAGKMCVDPTTPGDAQQVITGYEVGSVLYYSCNRQGFQISGPANYTCDFNAATNVAEWSNGLQKDSAGFPKCLDTQKPSFTGDCTKTFNLDKMSPVTFTPGSASDNFAVYSFSRSNSIRSGDVIITNVSVTYTATDFNNNVQTCAVNFNVIDRTIKPNLQCPDYVTVLISSPGVSLEYTVEGGSLQRADNVNTLSYNTSSQIVTNGSLVVTPTALSISVAKIGTAETVLAVANNTYGTRSTCTFVVNYKANACFQEQVFKDDNAVRSCSNVSSSLVCTSTCKSSYLYKDGTNVKNFTCSGTGSWDYTATTPNDRYCLQTVNPDYEVEVTIRYNYGFLTTGCETVFSSAINSHLEVFQTRLSNLCSGINWNMTVISATKTDTIAVFEARLKLTLITTSASVIARQECVNKTSSRPDTFDVVNKQLTCSGTSYSLTAQAPGFGTPVTTCALKTYKKITSSVTGGEICVSIGPAEFFDSVSASVMSCPVGQYQDGLAQTSCKTCSGDSYSNADRTSCQATCPKGFWSADGFYTCKPCAPDTYWANKTTCTPCPADTSTVDQEGVADISKCYPKCPVGSYSLSGYNITGCTLCPRNFYQDQTGQMMCKECNANQSTSQIGSTANANCTAINDTCDGTYCNTRGSCDFAYHRRVCTCNQGYYGDQCQYQYHICDGNPCTNGATCNRGASSTQYTCSCRSDLDECHVTVVNTTYIAKATVASISQEKVANSDACKALCLNTTACQEASYSSSISFCLMYNITLTPDQMILSGSGDVHFRKNCFRAFSGNDCEKDIKDQCTNANCNSNSKCIDKINDFQCVCPSAGGYTGKLCELTFEPCKVNPCVHGTCKAYGSVRYECTCDPGYEGLNCSQEIMECAPHPETCLYGGKCVDHVGGYHCECQNGFGGTRCEQPPNYCATQNCGSGNICYNSIDRMEGVCECDTDLFAPRFRCPMNKVENEGAAKPTDNLVDQAVSIDMNSCRDHCQNNKDCAAATYQYIPGPGYVCYLYNSSYTANITNNVTAFHKNCSDRPAQAYACDRIAWPCNSIHCNNGTCQNISNGLGATCVCQNGFTGSLCQHSIDDCVGNFCQNGATCVDRHLGYNCTCAPGYKGTNCQTNKNDCPGMCNTTRGMCEDRVNGYFCNCSHGFMGKDCEIEINECASYPCKHGGICTDLVNNYTCSCPQGWKGKQCDVRENYCEGQRQCLNGGECFSLDNSSFCRCQGGALGENCQNATLVCDVLRNISVCANNGVCVNSEGTATCSCPVVYDTQRCYFPEQMHNRSGGTGNTIPFYSSTNVAVTPSYCENLCLQIEECDAVTYYIIGSTNFCLFYKTSEISSPLIQQTGAVFSRRVCPTDYNGVSCEQVKNWCSENDSCKNGGTCTPRGPVGFQCQCAPGYSGVTCEVVNKPCDSNPCQGRATCRSTVTDYICQCPQGKEWTGTVCRDSSDNYSVMVNTFHGQHPPNLLTSFRLNTTEFSTMMFVRVHDVNEGNSIANLFSIIVTSDLDPKPDLEKGDYDFILTVNRQGVWAKLKGDNYTGLNFSEEFVGILHNGDWHHLGIAINSTGMMSVNIDALHAPPVALNRNLSLAANAQIFLGYGYIAEYENLTVWDRYLSTSQFDQAFVKEFRANFSPVQGWWNYRLTPSATRRTQRLPGKLTANPYLDVPNLNCEKAEDVHYTTSERLTKLTDINEIKEISDNVSVSVDGLAKNSSFMNTMTWGYYAGIIVVLNETTKKYGECRFPLYIRYYDKCPVIDHDSTVNLDNCTDPYYSTCSTTCASSPSSALSAPIPNYIICGSLGVYDYRKPAENFIMPSCTVKSNASYVFAVSVQYQFSISCTAVNTPANKLTINSQVKSTFNNPDKWDKFCNDSACSNMIMTDPICATTPPCTASATDCSKRIVIQFSLTLSSKTHTAKGGGEMPVEDALRIIIAVEKDIGLSNIASAQLVDGTLAITPSTQCPSGNTPIMDKDESVCVPCGKGWYYNNTTMKCIPCPYGSYQDAEAQTSCIACSNNSVTYQKGSTSKNNCILICSQGQFLDEDINNCTACPRHFYQNETGKNFCYPCKIGFKTAANESKSASDCKEDCPAGEYRKADTQLCALCPRGSWRDLTLDDCKPCPGNRTTYNGSRAASPQDCKIDKCNPGEYFNDTAAIGMCKNCSIGYYQDEIYTLECKRCPGNKTTRNMGSINVTNCEFYCTPGYKQLNMTETCVMCERGYYKDNVVVDKFGSCQQCPAGLTTDRKGAIIADNCSIPICQQGQRINMTTMSCENCPLDFFSNVSIPTSETQCQPCTPSCQVCSELYGTSTTGSTNSSQCKRYCEAGRQLDVGVCVMCPRGFYKTNVGNTRFDNCTKCDNVGGQEMTTDNEGSTSTSNCSVYKCTAGNEPNVSGCTPCPVDKYQPVTSPKSTDVCKQCPAKYGLPTGTNKTSAVSVDDCLAYCPSGKFYNGLVTSPTQCQPCPRGTYRDNVGDKRFFTACIPCPADTTTESTGSSTSANCSIPLCTSGQNISGGVCTNCSIDTYSEVIPTSTTTCIPCNTQYGTENVGTNNKTLCKLYCSAGTFFSGSQLTLLNQCQRCPRGTYRDNVGNNRFLTACIPCPANTTTESNGSSTTASCSIPNCSSGQIISGGVCTPCPVDTYSEVTSPTLAVKCLSCNTTCGVCNALYGTENVGTNNGSLCKPSCPAGEQFNSSSLRCEKCAIGYFKVASERFGACQSCETVNPGNVTSGTGATDGSQCNVSNCQPGYKIVGVKCEQCPVGTYQNESRKATCYPCGPNLNTSGPGKTSFNDCQVECGPGLQGKDVCTLCELGTYKPSAGYDACQSCPSNWNSNANRTACSVVYCDKGYEYKSTNGVESCQPCAAGYYKNVTGNIACTVCAAGTTTNGTGKSICDQPYCVPGEYLNSTCQKCPIGTFKDLSGNDNCTSCGTELTTGSTGATAQTQCDIRVCPVGQYREPSQKTLCTKCAVGTYQNNSGATSCISCPQGEFTLADGQVNEIACVPKCLKGQQYNASEVGAEKCDLCPLRTYKDTDGNTVQCTACPAGKTTVGLGSISATNCSQDVCPPGTYWTVQNMAIKCNACPVGTYSEKEMQSLCTSCGDNGTTYEMGSISNSSCIKKCPPGWGYQTDKKNCFICPIGQFNSKEEGLNPNTCKLCPSGKTNTQSGLTSCTYDTSPRVDKRVDLTVSVVYRIAIDRCDDRMGINLIIQQILKLLRDAVKDLKILRYNTDRTFCSESCINIVQKNPSDLPRCKQLATGKRAITNEIELDLVFKNISLYVIDQSDNNAEISVIEVISQLLELRKTLLTNTVVEVIYAGYGNITTKNLCTAGEYLVSNTCTQCPVGQFGSDGESCMPCPVDKYQDNLGQSSCTSCPANTYTETTNSTSLSNCIAICQAGSQFNSSSKTCSLCPVGYYKAVAGNTVACTACPDTVTTKGEGSTSVQNCSQAKCVEGQYFEKTADGSISCTTCPLGTYNPSKMAASCSACPAGKTTLLTGRVNVSDCITTCALGQGFSTSLGQCYSCPIGQYNDRTGLYPNTCKGCPSGKTNSQPGMSSCPDTVTAPVEDKRIDISVGITYSVDLTNCGDTNAKEQILLKIKVQIISVLTKRRNSRFNKLKSFCSEGCSNVVVNFASSSDFCTVRGRKKRALTHDLDFVVTMKNVTETSVDANTLVELPTSEVISQILKDDKADLSPDANTQFDSSAAPQTSAVCLPGQTPNGQLCSACSTGTKGTDGASCVSCPKDTYQNETGQSSCKDCPPLTFNDGERATGIAACKSFCNENPTYCNLRGVCTLTGRRTATCSCYEDYTGEKCEAKKEPTNDLPAILGGAIGGGGGLLVVILIIVGVYRYLSEKGRKPKKQIPSYGSDYYRNGLYDDTFYDNAAYIGRQPRPVAPYPSVGYPAIGYRPDASFEDPLYTSPYRTRPSIQGDDGPEDETRFVWKA